MVYIKTFFVVCLTVLLVGCSTLSKKDTTFEEGYRLGAKENISDFAKNFHGNDFPYFYWESPIVQDVRIPAHIKNGLFIPEHNEPVVITPAEWRSTFTYPIRCPKGKKALDKREEESYALEYLDFSIGDITVLPQSFICDKPGSEDKNPHR